MFNKALIAATIFAANACAENLLSAMDSFESLVEKDKKCVPYAGDCNSPDDCCDDDVKCWTSTSYGGN